MAFFMLNTQPISRQKGGCATRAAAYRAGERIRDERTGAICDWSSRDDVIHKEIFLPAKFAANAALNWARDRATLWNAVESTPRRNARVGREVLVHMPPELTTAQRVQLARRFGQELADRYLGAVDVTVHPPRPGETDRNHHAHLLMTPRQVTPEGLGQRTMLEQTGTNLRAMGLGSSKNELPLMRERWAQLTNETLRAAGLAIRVDHRSLKDTGVDREPRLTLPHWVVCIERRTGKPHEAGEMLRAAHRERVEARLKGPDELAKVLQKQKEASRQWHAERRRERAARPKGITSATYTAGERREMSRELYRNDESLREKHRANSRAYYEKNAEEILQKEHEARLRAQPHERALEKSRSQDHDQDYDFSL